MKILVLSIGKTDLSWINEGINLYLNRIHHYLPLEFKVIPEFKKLKRISRNEKTNLEGHVILKNIKKLDFVILLDEKGQKYNSLDFSKYLQKHMNSGVKRLVFVIGGAYGFSQSVYDRSNHQLSLSNMTFSHQMIRPFFLEQIYRACTILKNEPYHNE